MHYSMIVEKVASAMFFVQCGLAPALVAAILVSHVNHIQMQAMTFEGRLAFLADSEATTIA